LFLVLLRNLKWVCLIAKGFVQSCSMLLGLTRHSQRSCTSQEATVVCSTAPAYTSHLYRMHARKGPHLRYTSWLSTLAKKRNRDEFPKQHQREHYSEYRQEAHTPSYIHKHQELLKRQQSPSLTQPSNIRLTFGLHVERDRLSPWPVSS